MRPAPRSIPHMMPTSEQASVAIADLINLSRTRLNGWSIDQLVNEFGGSGQKWLTGSTVWLPAVFFECDNDTDLDIVFEQKESCGLFLKGVLGALPGYTLTSNTWGSGRILHPDGKHVIDAWHLEEDESIAELLLTFPQDYQRCAYALTWSGPSPMHLTRIVKPRTRIKETTGGYSRRRDIFAGLLAR